LKINSREFDPVPPSLLRKYIGYARKYVTPKLTPEAAKVLEDFYLTLRERHKSVDSTPITTRQLESLLRLSEARAKLELREHITEADAIEVVQIMKESLFETFEDEYGFVDFRRATGMSKSKQGPFFIAALTKKAEREFTTVFTMQQLYQVAQEIDLKVPSFQDFIDSLNNQNYLLKKKPGVYALYC